MHKKRTPWTTLILTVALAGFPPLSAPAPTDAQAKTATSVSLPLFGKVDLDYSTSGSFNTTTGAGQAVGRVRLTSEDYDLSCETLTFLSEKPEGKTGGRHALARVTAEPAAGGQVTADVRRPDVLHPDQGQAFHVVADHAAYVPDRSRPDGVRIDFTGHVQVTTTAGFLAVPSVTTTDNAVILLGQGEDYPQIKTGRAHVTATPAQQ